jgi:hypothetical protein
MSRRKPCKKTLPPIFSPPPTILFFQPTPSDLKILKKKPQKHKRALIFLIFHFWKCEKKGSTEDDTFNLFVTSLVERKRCRRFSIWICYSLLVLLLLLLVKKKEKILGAIKLENKPIYSCTKSCVYCIVLCCPPLLVLYDYRVHWIWFFSSSPAPSPH